MDFFVLVSNTDKGTEIEKFFWTKVHKLAFSCLYYLNDKNQRCVSIVYVLQKNKSQQLQYILISDI